MFLCGRSNINTLFVWLEMKMFFCFFFKWKHSFDGTHVESYWTVTLQRDAVTVFLELL